MAEHLGRFEAGQYDKIKAFLADPEAWSADRAAARKTA
jgi:hypothetical protein